FGVVFANIFRGIPFDGQGVYHGNLLMLLNPYGVLGGLLFLLLSSQTVLGAAKLLMDSGEHPGQLKDRVTSPGGTAIAGIHTLEEGGLRTTIINAVESATRRSRELGQAMIEDFQKNNGK
ncbi:MAG: hypothetical protein HQK66_11910, partial [Desulfamplus sp.]|nr:hypothetical protein [Desulfamplus sp.]